MNCKPKIDLFIGHFIENETTVLPNGISFAGNYYQRKVRTLLNIKYSISLLYKIKNINYANNAEVGFIELKHRKHFRNVFHVLKSVVKLHKNGIKYQTVLFYNLSFYSLFYYFYYVLFTKTKVIVLLADAGFIIEKSFLNRVLTKALSFAHGILSLREISELQNFKCKIEIMPGLIVEDDFSETIPKKKNTVFMSGSLRYTTGLDLALRFFANQDDFKLILSGTPYLMSDEEFYSLMTKYKSQNIEYRGILEYEEYKSLLSTCEFGLSLRNPSDLEHRANFPSKILEYMSFECIVISSISYNELNKGTYLLTEYSVVGMQTLFNNILINLNNEKRDLIIKTASSEIKEKYSPTIFKKKITNLISSAG